MQLHLFAGIYVRDYEAARSWYARLFGFEPSFLPHATEAVWVLAEDRSIYINENAGHAGHATHTVFVDDLDERVSQISARGIEPAKRETYANGVRKVLYRDPDGNEIGFGGAPLYDMADVLTARALNRALLQRQGLLERQPGPALEWVERLVGLQAQEPPDPYVALWSRIRDFDPLELSDALGERRAVRASLLRGTIHLVSARDCLGLHPLTQPLLNRIWKPAWQKRLGGAPVDEIVAAGRELLAERPRPRAELQRLLAPRWPEAEPLALAYVVTYMLPLVQVTPRGQWRASHQATWALAEDWLGAPLDAGATVDDLVRRYLAAFGPATVSDMRTWCGLNGLRAVFERLRPELRVFRDERGRELFDVPDGPLPDPETPAPPRFLGTYDNLLLAHDDRSRVQAGLGPGLPVPRGGWIGTLIVDGCYRAFWRLEEADDTATLTIDRFTPHADDPDDAIGAIIDEGERLVAFVAPEAAPSVRFDPVL